MVATVEHRFGLVDQLLRPIKRLSDNGSCYVAGILKPSPATSG